MNLDTHLFTTELNFKLNKRGMTGAWFVRCKGCGNIAYTWNANYPRTSLERSGWVESHGWHCPDCWKNAREEKQ